MLLLHLAFRVLLLENKVDIRGSLAVWTNLQH